MSGVQPRMKTKVFPSPVPIRFGKIGLIHSVATVEEAAKLLRDPRWPNKGRVNLRARMACLEAANGLGTCHDAWEAFVQAARVAGVLLEED
jgi:hypothetical protein